MRKWSLTRRVLWILVLVGLLLAGFIASLAAMQCTESLAHTKRTTTLTIRGETLDAEGTKQVLEKSATTEGIPSYVLWEERGQETLVNPALARTTKVNVVLAEGNVGFLINGAFLPEQTLPNATSRESYAAQEKDASTLRALSTNETNSVATSAEYQVSAHTYAEQTCIIDRATALELFGDVQVVGLQVSWNTQEFRVDAVLESARPLLIIRPSEQSGTAFNMLTAENLSGLSSATFGEELASSLGIDAEVLEYDLLYYLGHLMAWLPTLLLAFGYGVFLLVQGFSKHNAARLQTVYLLGFLITSVVLTAFVAITIELPRELIPSRFSDFTLWHQIQENTGSAFSLLFDTAVYVPHASLFDGFYRVLAFSVVSLSLYVGAIWLLSKNCDKSSLARHAQRKDRALKGPTADFLPGPLSKRNRVLPAHSPVRELPRTCSHSRKNDSPPFLIPKGARGTKAGNDDIP